MVEPTSNLDTIELVTIPQSPKPNHKRHFAAAILSSLIPGAGQFALHDVVRGIFFFVLLLACCAGFWPLRLLKTFYGLGLVSLFWLALFVLATADALAHSRQGRDTPSKWWLLLFLPVSLVTAHFIGAGLTRAAGFRSFSIPSTSMETTLIPGDTIIADMWYYRHDPPHNGDLVIFRRQGLFLVKRVLASGGDIVMGKDGEVFRNGKRLDEPYVLHKSENPPLEDDLINFGPQNISTGNYFVMGDYRDDSYDSRMSDYGPVDLSSIEGRPLYIFHSTGGRSGKELH